jgi:hypothetical protein
MGSLTLAVCIKNQQAPAASANIPSRPNKWWRWWLVVNFDAD